MLPKGGSAPLPPAPPQPAGFPQYYHIAQASAPAAAMPPRATGMQPSGQAASSSYVPPPPQPYVTPTPSSLTPFSDLDESPTDILLRTGANNAVGLRLAPARPDPNGLVGQFPARLENAMSSRPAASFDSSTLMTDVVFFFSGENPAEGYAPTYHQGRIPLMEYRQLLDTLWQAGLAVGDSRVNRCKGDFLIERLPPSKTVSTSQELATSIVDLPFVVPRASLLPGPTGRETAVEVEITNLLNRYTNNR